MGSSDYNNDFYSDIFSEKSESYYQMHKKKFEIALSMIEGLKGERILDIGCGDGKVANMFAEKLGGAVSYGIEISKSAAKKAKKLGVNAQVADISCQKIPFENDYFDVVFAGDVIEHIYDTETLLKDILRVLKPGGILVATVPNLASWYNRGFLLIGWLPTWVESASKIYTGNPFMKEGVGHIRAFTKKSIRELFCTMGFSNIRIKGSPLLGNGEFSEMQEKIWNMIDGIMSKIASIASEIVVSGTKPIYK